MIPWIIMAVVVVPLLVVAYAASRRTRGSEALATQDPEVARRTEQEFADAERFEREWREANKPDDHLLP